jgi:DNA end-binding protein Ku
VNAPVRIYSAIEEHQVHFHLLHRKDDSPIGYEKICKKENRPVPDDEIVKGFEYAKGRYVYMEDEDFEAARVEGYKTIEITDFVPYDDIDPIFFAKTYYVGPSEGAEQVYALLARAMDESGLAAVAKFVMRDRQHLGVLRVRDRVIMLEQLHFADEVRPTKELAPAKQRVDSNQLEMASRLIESYTTTWDPARYEDTYRKDLLAVVEAKRKGKDVHAEAETGEEEPATDLMAALRESIRKQSAGGSRRRRSRPRRSDSLDGLSKDELAERARRAGVAGRSKMTKRELVAALRRAA